MALVEGEIAKTFLSRLGIKAAGIGLGPVVGAGFALMTAYDIYKAFAGDDGPSPEQKQFIDAQTAEGKKASDMRLADLTRQERKRQNEQKLSQGAALGAGALEAEEQSGLGTMQALGNSGNIVGSGMPFMGADASLSRAQAYQMSGEVAPHWSQMYGLT